MSEWWNRRFFVFAQQTAPKMAVYGVYASSCAAMTIEGV